jgi:hypothetical protein
MSLHCEVKIFENKPETWRGAGVNQASGRIRPVGRQLAISCLSYGFLFSHRFPIPRRGNVYLCRRRGPALRRCVKLSHEPLKARTHHPSSGA